jgi:hypothetical protein
VTGPSRRTFTWSATRIWPKFWLDPVRLHESGGFRGAELNRVAALVGEHQALLLEAWREYFGE